MGELESIEDVLAAHEQYSVDTAMYGYDCTCGWGWHKDIKRTADELRTHLADAIRAHLADVAGRDEVREAVANTIPLGWTDRDPYRDIFEAADAAVGAYLQAIGHQP